MKEAHARCPINGDDVNGQTPLHSGGSLAHDKVDIPSEWWRAQSDSDPSGSVDLIQQGIVIVWRDHLHMQRHHRLLAYHPYMYMVHIADFRDFRHIRRFSSAISSDTGAPSSNSFTLSSTVATRYAEPEATPVSREWGQQVSSQSR